MKLSTSLLLGTLLFIIGCGPTTTTPINSNPTTQTSTYPPELTWFIKNDNKVIPYDFIIADAEYMLVDEEWFNVNVMDTFNDFLAANGVYFADKKRNDCDNFARAFSFHARVKSMQSKNFTSDLAVGDLYFKNLEVGHAINIAILLDKNGNKKLVFIEPQGPKYVELSAEYKEFYISYIGL